MPRLDARSQALAGCVHNSRSSLQRWGRTLRGLQRWRCTDCGRTFSSTTGTVLAGVRRPEGLFMVLEDMMSDRLRSCRALAGQLGIDKMTVWRWRMGLLRALLGHGEIRARQLKGIVEVDETFFREPPQGLVGMGRSRA